MSPLINALIVLIALLHAYFLILEMFLWTHPVGLRAFGQRPEKAETTKVLAGNQGLYNGFLVAGLLWSVFQKQPEFAGQLKIFFLTCISIAGIYGAFTVHRKIFFIQSLPALIALALVLFS